MKSETDRYIALLRDFKKSKSENYGITEIGLFGSVARGEQREDSDIDVFVTMSKPNLMLLVGIKQDLEMLFQKPVDVVRLHSHMSPVFLRNIRRDGVYA